MAPCLEKSRHSLLLFASQIAFWKSPPQSDSSEYLVFGLPWHLGPNTIPVSISVSSPSALKMWPTKLSSLSVSVKHWISTKTTCYFVSYSCICVYLFIYLLYATSIYLMFRCMNTFLQPFLAKVQRIGTLDSHHRNSGFGDILCCKVSWVKINSNNFGNGLYHNDCLFRVCVCNLYKGD